MTNILNRSGLAVPPVGPPVGRTREAVSAARLAPAGHLDRVASVDVDVRVDGEPHGRASVSRRQRSGSGSGSGIMAQLIEQF